MPSILSSVLPDELYHIIIEGLLKDQIDKKVIPSKILNTVQNLLVVSKFFSIAVKKYILKYFFAETLLDCNTNTKGKILFYGYQLIPNNKMKLSNIMDELNNNSIKGWIMEDTLNDFDNSFVNYYYGFPFPLESDTAKLFMSFNNMDDLLLCHDSLKRLLLKKNMYFSKKKFLQNTSNKSSLPNHKNYIDSLLNRYMIERCNKFKNILTSNLLFGIFKENIEQILDYLLPIPTFLYHHQLEKIKHIELNKIQIDSKNKIFIFSEKHRLKKINA